MTVTKSVYQAYDHIHTAYDYIVTSSSGAFQVLQQMSYGEMIISFLLMSILLLAIFKWIWEALR